MKPTKGNGSRKGAASTAMIRESSNTAANQSQGVKVKSGSWPAHLQDKAITSQQAMAVHAAAIEIPRMKADEIADLKTDIETNGIKVPLIFNKALNTIIDGRHRWEIAYALGLRFSQIPIEVFEGTDAQVRHLVWQHNGLRRQMQLTADQRAALGAKMLGRVLRYEAEKRMRAGLKSAQPFRAADQLSKQAKVGRDKARAALQVLDKEPEALEHVIKGEKRLADVAKVAKPSKPTKDKPFEDRIWEKWLTWLKKFSPDEVREIKALVHGWTAPSAKARQSKIKDCMV